MMRIVKVGGSLLTWNELPNRLRDWLETQPAANTYLIAGGGPWAELLRQAAKRFELPEEQAHEMCVQAMSVTASLLGEIAGCTCIRDKHLLTEMTLASFDSQQWLSQNAETKQPLPRTWSVTSDSIAAQLAVDLAADELVLLKSADPPTQDLTSLAESGYVDEHFPIVAAKIPEVRFVNLRKLAV